MMRKRESLVDLLADESTDAQLKSTLVFVQKVRDFASAELGLPENNSYRSYADLGRPYVTWNVVATPPFSLQPERWCFPVAGCVSYRGFFEPQRADKFAGPLRDAGKDVYVYGVGAYSTLGWFDDPVLNTMLTRGRLQLAALIFHELAHQKLYVKNDSGFNESFATAVQQLGIERWLSRHGNAQELTLYRRRQYHRQLFLGLVQSASDELELLYESDLPDDRKKHRKEKVFLSLQQTYRELARQDPGFKGYARWFSEDLNNAKLAGIATYYHGVPFFRRLFVQQGGDFAGFYREVDVLAKLPAAERAALF